MKALLKRVLCLSLSLVIVLGLTACGNDAGTSSKKAELLSMEVRPDAPEEIPDGLDIDWNHRYTYAELESQLAKMNETYTDITDLYPIGSSWQERNLWCLEITNKNIPAEEKTGIGVFANIHGGERESASSAMYTAWWMTLCSSDEYVKGLLDNYIIYVIPVINPDSYERSFVVKTRETLHPLDKNGDGVPYNDPCTDIDGDGLISTIYRGTADYSMCLPFIMDKAERFSTKILNNMPSGVVVVNEDLEVQQLNRTVDTVGGQVFKEGLVIRGAKKA